MTILKVLVERQDTLVDDVLESPEFRDVINAITKVMDHFRGEGLLRLKIKFCNLIEIACTRFDSFGFRSDDESRNGVLSIVSEWFEPDVSIFPFLSDHVHRIIDFSNKQDYHT